VSIELVLNELSQEPRARSVAEGRGRMTQFINTVLALRGLGVYSPLRSTVDLNDCLLADDYRLVQWRNDHEVSREQRQFWRSLGVKVPLLREQDPVELRDRAQEFEFRLMGEEARGLGVTFLLDGMALSFASEKRWDSGRIEILVRFLDEAGELSVLAQAVHHASSPAHVIDHRSWVRDCVRGAARDGEDLWMRREELFPTLVFCDRVARQLKDLTAGNPLLRAVSKRLFELEEYFAGWSTGPFCPDRLPSRVSPESQGTLNQYRRERTFRCPDGEYRLFRWHVRITPHGWRIFFFPDEKSRRCLIGYIGPKLPTMDFPG